MNQKFKTTNAAELMEELMEEAAKYPQRTKFDPHVCDTKTKCALPLHSCDQCGQQVRVMFLDIPLPVFCGICISK
jgi:hypothetical protein